MNDATLLLARVFETEITDETDNVSNVDFLEGIFGSCSDGLPPLVVSFGGDPRNAKQSAWYAAPLLRATPPLANRNVTVQPLCGGLDRIAGEGAL
jgi:hypothetical protein